MAKCMQCGGMKKATKMKKGGVKKMAAGGSTTNKLNNARGFAPAQKGGSNTKMMIYGIPNAGMTGPNRNSQTETMKKGGAKKTLTKAQTGRAMSKYTFAPDYTPEGTKIQSGVKYGKGNKKKYLDINPSAGTVTKMSFNKNNKATTKTKNVGVDRATKMISKITPKSKKGGSVKKALTKAQAGRAMTSGPFDKATTDYLNTKYPGTAVRVPYDPEYYAEPQSQSDYTPMAELEADDRRRTEARMRSANNREDFNAGSMEGYRRGGTKKTMMKKGGAKKSTVKKSIKKYQKGGSATNEYDRNIARAMDADKELNYIMDSAYGRANERISNANRKYSGTGRTRISEGAPENLGVRSPYATDADMAAYDKEIAAFYKANPGMKPYVGTLKPKAATTIKKKGGSVKKMATGGSLKKVDSTKNPGLAKLPTEVRNKMGYQKTGGATPKAKFGASVKVQRSPKAGKVRSASAQGYASVGKRESGRVIKKVIGKKK
jgi:hypothetical protein